MPLGPLPGEIVSSEKTKTQVVDSYIVFSEIAKLHGGDGFYGIKVVIADNSLKGKISMTFSFQDIPERVVEKEYTTTTKDGMDEALEIERSLRQDAEKFIAESL